MNIVLRVHMELLDNGQTTWWAESDQLPGFVVQEASLRELLPVAASAVREVAADRKLEVADIRATLVQGEPESFGAETHPTLNPSPEPQSVGESRSIVRERELAAV